MPPPRQIPPSTPKSQLPGTSGHRYPGGIKHHSAQYLDTPPAPIWQARATPSPPGGIKPPPGGSAKAAPSIDAMQQPQPAMRHRFPCAMLRHHTSQPHPPRSCRTNKKAPLTGEASSVCRGHTTTSTTHLYSSLPRNALGTHPFIFPPQSSTCSSRNLRPGRAE